ARHDRGTQSNRATEALGRAHGLFRSLPVDVKDPGKGKDEINALVRRHGNFSKALTQPIYASGFGLQRQPAAASGANAPGNSPRRSPRKASPFSLDRRRDRIRPRRQSRASMRPPSA